MAKHHSDETKAAVMAALLAGQSIAAVAETYHIPEGTVKYWSANLDRTEYQPEPTTKKEIGELIIGYLSDLLITLRAQLKVYADEKWLRQQSASEVAVLHGVLADKGIRLLEALAGDEEGETHNV
jgi:transposase-like protein